MDMTTYAARKGRVINSLVEWAEGRTEDPDILRALKGQVGNVTSEVRELFRLEALQAVLSSPAAQVPFTSALIDLTEVEASEISALVADFPPQAILQLVGQELSMSKPDRAIVTALEKAYMTRVKASQPVTED